MFLRVFIRVNIHRIIATYVFVAFYDIQIQRTCTLYSRISPKEIKCTYVQFQPRHSLHVIPLPNTVQYSPCLKWESGVTHLATCIIQPCVFKCAVGEVMKSNENNCPQKSSLNKTGGLSQVVTIQKFVLDMVPKNAIRGNMPSGHISEGCRCKCSSRSVDTVSLWCGGRREI
jgi:hypothetical protein